MRPLDDFRRIGRHLLTGEGDGPGKKYGIQFVHDSLRARLQAWSHTDDAESHERHEEVKHSSGA